MAKIKRILKIALIVTASVTMIIFLLAVIYDLIYNRESIFADSSCNASKLELSGEITTATADDFLSKLNNAEDNEQSKAIFINFDSPGGSLSGGEAIRTALASSTKPIINLVRDACDSSCYLALTGLKEINLLKYSEVGDIGVIIEHYDGTVQNQKDGIGYDAIVTGKYKSINTSDRKMTDEERAILQEQIDYEGSLFFNDVKTARGLSEEQMAKIKNAEVYNGQRAIAAGLADHILTWTDAIEKVRLATGDSQVKWCE